MGTKILAISGSRDKNGQTAKCIYSLLEGAKENGAETEVIFLPDKKIEHCRQCEKDGWGMCAKEGRCIIDDDFYEVFNKIKKSDCIVFATPVYLWEPSESFWAFGTRMRRICFKWGKYDTVDKKPAIVIAVAGGGGTGAIRTIFQVEQMLEFTGFDVVDYIPVKRLNLSAKLPQIKLAGKWLATKPKTLE